MLHETVPELIRRVTSQVGKPNVIEFPDLAITVFHESSMLHWTRYNYAKIYIYKLSSNRPVNKVLIFHHHQNIFYNSGFGISYNIDTLLCPSLFAHCDDMQTPLWWYADTTVIIASIYVYMHFRKIKRWFQLPFVKNVVPIFKALSITTKWVKSVRT